MRALQHHLVDNWDRKVDSLQEVIHIPKAGRRLIAWWQERNKLATGRLWFPPHQIRIKTDASAYGWGAHIEQQARRDLGTSHVGGLLQSQGTDSSSESATSFPGSGGGETCPDPFGQRHHSDIYQPPGGNQVKAPHDDNTPTPIMGRRSPAITDCGTHKRVMQHPSRLSKPNPAGPSSVGAEPRDVCKSCDEIGSTGGQPFRHFKVQESGTFFSLKREANVLGVDSLGFPWKFNLGYAFTLGWICTRGIG